MTKKNKIVVGLSVVLGALVITSGAAAMTNGFRDFNPDHFIENVDGDDLLMDDLSNIHFTNVKESTLTDGTIRKEVTFTLTPGDASSDDLNANLTWDEEENENYESADWYVGKNVLDYVTFQLDGASRRLTFDCSSPFGTGMIFTLSAKNDPSVNASLKLNYKRREIKKASAELESGGYVPDSSMRITTSAPVYSIGSSGERAPSEPFTLRVEYIEGDGHSFDDLFAGISTTGLYAQMFKYDGKDYDDPASVLKDMKENVSSYLTSLPSLEEDKIFETGTLRRLLTYQYASNRTYEIVYSESTINFTSFIKKYDEAIESGYGYQVTVSLAEEEIYERLLPIDIELDDITDIKISEDEIEF